MGSLVGAPGFQQAGVVQHSVATHAVVKIACWKAGYYSQRVVVGCQEDPLHRLVQEYSGCETLTVEDIHRIPADCRHSRIPRLQIPQDVILADVELEHRVDRMMHKEFLAPGLQEVWVYGNKAQQHLHVQNNWSERQGFAVVVGGGWKSGLAETDRCEWEGHAGHIGCATVELAGDVDSAGVADVDGESSTHVVEPVAVGVAAEEPGVDGSGVVGDAVVRIVGWVTQLPHYEMVSESDVRVVKQMWQ